MPAPLTTPQVRAEYQRLKNQPRALDMTRGKPSAEQLALSNRVLTLPGAQAGDYIADDGTDVRNYGGLDGLPAMKQLFADILAVPRPNVLVGGNSSLSMMYDALARACQFGVLDNAGNFQPAWHRLAARKFICPTPGYDRHFLVTEHLGFELLAVDMTESGPDMRQVEALVAADAAIKGIWCVPKYSNPTGVCYSDATVQRLARMKTAAADFRIMWDNAYAEHHFTGPPQRLENIARCGEAAGHPNRVLQFASTSKISHPGSGVAAMASSDANITEAKSHIAVQSIGPDKVNQLRHIRLFGAHDTDTNTDTAHDRLSGLRAHMKKHARLVTPKFAAVLEILERELGGLGLAQWSTPKGGYFISLDIPDGKAARAIELTAAAGVKLTAAGAPFPYGKDPRDRNIRLAPTFPPLQDIKQATEILAVCVQLAASE